MLMREEAGKGGGRGEEGRNDYEEVMVMEK